MKNAIILHGCPDKEEYYDPKAPSMSNAHWIPWLQGQLLKLDIPTNTPEVPWSYKRDWETWNKEVERFEITPETILIGHSTGAGFFIKYLCIHPELKVDRMILVAPWLDPNKESNIFDNFEYDTNLIHRTNGIKVFFSDNDMDTVLKSVEIIKNKFTNVVYKEFHNYGHFCIGDLKTVEFPELLQTVVE